MTAIRLDFAYGDSMIATPLLRELAQAQGQPVEVVAPPKYRDAYHNLPWVRLVEEAPEAPKHIVDLTPGHHFDRLKCKYGPQISLLDVPWLRARELGLIKHLPPGPQRLPVLLPEEREQQRVLDWLRSRRDRPLVAVESAFFSNQSWLDRAAVQQLLGHYGHTHHILWLSPQDYPEHPAVERMEGLTRRECILMITHCAEFVSTGSGLFCGSLGVPFGGRTICLWRDDYYKYEQRFLELSWRPVEWVHDHRELALALDRRLEQAP